MDQKADFGVKYENNLITNNIIVSQHFYLDLISK